MWYINKKAKLIPKKTLGFERFLGNFKIFCKKNVAKKNELLYLTNCEDLVGYFVNLIFN